MAGCERGYLCVVCGEEVEEIEDSDLYLRYVLGDVDGDCLHQLPERHIRCDPVLAQFIVTESFDPVTVDGSFSKGCLDPEFVSSEEARVTQGYLRLREVAHTRVPIWEYPLAEVRDRLAASGSDTFPKAPAREPDGTKRAPPRE
jgi:hypothetical protein